MAKMHSRKRGTSGSKKLLAPSKPSWQRYKAKEIEMLISKLSKEGKNGAQIGIILRDSYGIPSIRLLLSKRLGEYLDEKKLTAKFPDDLTALMKRAVMTKKHLEANTHDMHAKRGLQLTEAKIKRLGKYYKGTGKLPIDWKYDPRTLKLLTE
jgi:small subunit ribosomal protein S15